MAFGVYGTVLPSEAAGGQLNLANWAYLTGSLLAFPIVLGLATVLALRVYAVRQAAAARWAIEECFQAAKTKSDSTTIKSAARTSANAT